MFSARKQRKTHGVYTRNKSFPGSKMKLIKSAKNQDDFEELEELVESKTKVKKTRFKKKTR